MSGGTLDSLFIHHLTACAALESLTLFWCVLSPVSSDIVQLADLTKLTHLSIYGSVVTDTALKRFQTLSSLKVRCQMLRPVLLFSFFFFGGYFDPEYIIQDNENI